MTEKAKQIWNEGSLAKGFKALHKLGEYEK